MEVAVGLCCRGGPQERVDLLGGHDASAQESHATFDLGPRAVGSARGDERAPEGDVGERRHLVFGEAGGRGELQRACGGVLAVVGVALVEGDQGRGAQRDDESVWSSLSERIADCFAQHCRALTESPER